jgi:predicted AlkP superfamily phosphohydrolase/phosphomutase
MHGYTEKVPELAGIFVMKFHNTRKKKIQNMKLYDIAPTILKAMNIEIPTIWDGKSRV